MRRSVFEESTKLYVKLTSPSGTQAKALGKQERSTAEGEDK
jgi:hypothetical protein